MIWSPTSALSCSYYLPHHSFLSGHNGFLAICWKYSGTLLSRGICTCCCPLPGTLLPESPLCKCPHLCSNIVFLRRLILILFKNCKLPLIPSYLNPLSPSFSFSTAFPFHSISFTRDKREHFLKIKKVSSSGRHNNKGTYTDYEL